VSYNVKLSFVIPQCEALRFTDDKISWVFLGSVTVFSRNDTLRLRRLKNVKFGTKVAYSTRMMHALAVHFWKRFLNLI